MNTRLRAAWKFSVAMAMLWLSGESFGIDLSSIPHWRVAAGIVLLFMFVEYLTEAADWEEEKK